MGPNAGPACGSVEAGNALAKAEGVMATEPMAMEFTGRCLCGRVRYLAAGAPLWVAHCHCESCRRATGAPLATYAGFAGGSLRLDGGRARALRLVAGRDADLLRPLRHVAHLSGRALAGRDARAGGDAGPARGGDAAERGFCRGAPRVAAPGAGAGAAPKTDDAAAFRHRSGGRRCARAHQGGPRGERSGARTLRARAARGAVARAGTGRRRR